MFKVTVFLVLIPQVLFSQEHLKYKFIDEIERMQSEGKYRESAIAFSLVGCYEKSLSAYDKQINSEVEEFTHDDSLYFSSFKPEEAISSIIELAKDKRIVILNEAHHQPRHRVFALKLMRELYKIGYKYMGVETLTNCGNTLCDSLLETRGYPLISSETGIYSREPQFGNLIREAIRIGCKPFAYESMEHKNWKEREANQALNIKRILDSDTTLKVFIYCGYNHSIESALPENDYGEDVYMMAGFLKNLLHEDPLTIDQVILSERGSQQFENPLYRRIDIAGDVIFKNKDNHFYCGKSEPNCNFDVIVYHSRTKLTLKRPQWLLYDDDMLIYPAKCLLNEFEPPMLVKVFFNNSEPSSSVPNDIVVLSSYDEDVGLVLKKGVNKIVAEKKDGSFFDFNITIE